MKKIKITEGKIPTLAELRREIETALESERVSTSEDACVAELKAAMDESEREQATFVTRKEAQLLTEFYDEEAQTNRWAEIRIYSVYPEGDPDNDCHYYTITIR